LHGRRLKQKNRHGTDLFPPSSLLLPPSSPNTAVTVTTAESIAGARLGHTGTGCGRCRATPHDTTDPAVKATPATLGCVWNQVSMRLELGEWYTKCGTAEIPSNYISLEVLTKEETKYHYSCQSLNFFHCMNIS
jgi:hypothetical protein